MPYYLAKDVLAKESITHELELTGKSYAIKRNTPVDVIHREFRFSLVWQRGWFAWADNNDIRETEWPVYERVGSLEELDPIKEAIEFFTLVGWSHWDKSVEHIHEQKDVFNPLIFGLARTLCALGWKSGDRPATHGWYSSKERTYKAGVLTPKELSLRLRYVEQVQGARYAARVAHRLGAHYAKKIDTSIIQADQAELKALVNICESFRMAYMVATKGASLLALDSLTRSTIRIFLRSKKTPLGLVAGESFTMMTTTFMEEEVDNLRTARELTISVQTIKCLNNMAVRGVWKE